MLKDPENIKDENIEEILEFLRFSGHLSKNGRVAELLNNDEEIWTLEKQILSSIEVNTRTNIWAKTKNGQKGINAPEIILPKGLKEAIEKQEQLEQEQSEKDQELINMFSYDKSQDTEENALEFLDNFQSFTNEKIKEGFSKKEATRLYMERNNT